MDLLFAKQNNKAMHKLMIYLICLCPAIAMAQTVKVEGYVYEENNRGFLREVLVSIAPIDQTNVDTLDIRTDKNGKFELMLPANKSFYLKAAKDLFYTHEQNLTTTLGPNEKAVYLKIELRRRPGYVFDITMAEKREPEDTSAALGIEGAWIEIYNNTKAESVFALRDYNQPNFKYTFQKGNHYTLLIRKDGYFAKRLEARIDVDGCILCFDGLSRIENVTDNLTAGFEMGTILANIELEKANVGSTFQIENIYYDFGKASIKGDASESLDHLYNILKDNPHIVVELGSHTDSRGGDFANMVLSEKRAQNAVNYLVRKGISSGRISAKGYGETEIYNHCKDGVDCSEEEHQINRRTEIKVLDVGGAEIAEPQSLEEIKRSEQYLEKLEDAAENTDVVVISGDTPTDDMPDDLKAYIAAQQKKEMKEKMASAETMSPSYTGFAIEMQRMAADSLVEDWVLQFDTIYVDQINPKERSVYIALFDDIGAAQIFYEEKGLDKYSAKIIEYKEGKRN